MKGGDSKKKVENAWFKGRCLTVHDSKFEPKINLMWSISKNYLETMILLMPSFLFLFNDRSLRCTRIRIHKNLFVSFIMNSILWILWYRLVVDRTEQVILHNEVCCFSLSILMLQFGDNFRMCLFILYVYNKYAHYKVSYYSLIKYCTF